MRKFGPRGMMAAACLSFAAYGAISGAIGLKLPGLAGTAGSLAAALGSTGAALLPWLQGVLFEKVGAGASIALIVAGALVMLALFAGYRLAARGAAARALAG